MQARDGGSRARGRRFVVAALACLLALAGTAYAANNFAAAPNDPDYAPQEDNDQLTDCVLSPNSADDQEHEHFAFAPQCAPGASADGPAGMSAGCKPTDWNNAADKCAWRDFTAGNDETLISYIEAGINWHRGNADLVDKVFLNDGELPTPTDPVGDGVLNRKDFLVFDDIGPDNPTPDANANGYVDPEDIIKRFQDGVDDDNNGYTDDISGWDFYDDQNDPATVDSKYNHANGQMEQAAADGNNGSGGLGICPKCMVMPIKGGAEALDRTDDLAESWLYAADMNSDVLVSVTADLGYSSFMADAVDYVWRHGTVMVEASNDFNSTDHQGGMFHPHVLPGNGLVSNAHGIPGPDQNALIRTFRARASYTSWGTHNMFSAATTGGTTSEATPSVGGALALVLAYGKESALQPGGLNDAEGPLTNAEAIQVVRDTADDITGNPSAPQAGWEGKPGFDLQYGYGRPNLYEAMQEIADNDVPPVGWIDSPDWYSLYDPTTTSSVPVTGHVEAERSSSYTWKLEFAPGAEPADGDFATANTGNGTNPDDRSLGSIDLSDVPQSFWSKAYKLSENKELETSENYTVTIRLTVTDAQGRKGEERRTIAVQNDPSLKSGFPKRIASGGESQPVLADLQGTGELATIFGDSDGNVHAFKPNGQELNGWPIHTNATEVEEDHLGVDPGDEPIVAPVAVGDLDHDGKLWVVASTITGRVYAWDSQGNRRSGWPKTLNTGVTDPPITRPDMAFTRLPHLGATASPVLADLNEDDKLEVVQAGWDGHIHVYKQDGSELTGFPLEVKLPIGDTPQPPNTEVVQDHKVDVPPGIAQLDGDPEPELVVRSQYNDVVDSGLQPGGVSHIHAYNADGSSVGGFPTDLQGTVIYYGSAQEFITEGANAPSVANVDGDAEDEIAASPAIFSPTYLIQPNGQVGNQYGPSPDATEVALLQGSAGVGTLTGVLNGQLPNDTPVGFTTSGAFGKFGPGDQLAFAEPGSGAGSVASSLLLAGSGIPINSYMRAYNAQSGAVSPGFPQKTQGLDFLGMPTIADLTGDGSAELIEGGDSSALHAFTSTGAQASGFPKFMTGWMLWAPIPGDIDSDGKNEVVGVTREGYLMAWKTDGRASGNDEWWNYRHDERNTGRYGTDTRPPGVIREASFNSAGTEFKFLAPGGDWYSGTAKEYKVTFLDGSNNVISTTTQAASGETGTQESIQNIPPTAQKIKVQPVDHADNLGGSVTLARGESGGGEGGGGSDPIGGSSGVGSGQSQSGSDGGKGGSGEQKKGKPSLKLKLKRRGGRRSKKAQASAASRSCASSVVATLSGGDVGEVSRLDLYVGKKRVTRDGASPFKGVIKRRYLKRKKVKIKARVLLRDGRTATLTKRVRVCSR